MVAYALYGRPVVSKLLIIKCCLQATIIYLAKSTNQRAMLGPRQEMTMLKIIFGSSLPGLLHFQFSALVSDQKLGVWMVFSLVI